MATIDTAWVIGSVRDASYGVTFTVLGVPSAQTITGDKYLYHATSSLGLLGQMVTKMGAGGVGAPGAALQRDRKIRLQSNATFAVTWTNTVLRNLLGFTGNLSGASSYTATNISPLLWSPGKPVYFELSPTGVLGNTKPLSYWTTSPSDGSTFVVSHGERTDQRFSASHVEVARMQTASAAGGEWDQLFQQSLALGHSFFVYPSVTEDSASTSNATISGGKGPYVLSPRGRAASWDYKRSRGFEWLNRRADVSFDCRVVPEYT